MYEKVAIITQILHRDKCYFTNMSSVPYLITVPNITNITTFVSEISQQIHKMYEKVVIITEIWHRGKCYFTSMSNAGYLITVPNMNKITTFFSDRS